MNVFHKVLFFASALFILSPIPLVGQNLAQVHLRPHVEVDSFCTSWNVCIYDSTFGLPAGINSVTLLDSYDGVKPLKIYFNTRLDDSLDPNRTNQITFPPNDTSVCFNVLVNRLYDSAYAPIFIIDSQGYAVLLNLRYYPPIIMPRNGNFIGVSLMKDSCSSFVYKNIPRESARNFEVSSVSLQLNNPDFKITNISQSLPTTLKPGDSLIISTCFTPKDALNQVDTILIATGCFTAPISLVGKGISSGVAEQPLCQLSFNVSPNPVSDNAIILMFPSLLDFKSTIIVNDILGRVVYKQEIYPGISQIKILLPKLDNGMYYVRLSSGNRTSTRKFEIIK